METILTAVAEFIGWLALTALICFILVWIGKEKDKRDLRKCQYIGRHTGDHDWEMSPDNYMDREETCKICGKRRTY